MASHRIGETGLSDPGPSSTQPLGYGVHGIITPPATSFFVQDGASSYFGELEEALIQGVVSIRGAGGDRKAFLNGQRPPTLEIFPSWPMQGNSQSAESTDSGSLQPDSDSPVSINNTSNQATGQEKPQPNTSCKQIWDLHSSYPKKEDNADMRRLGGSTTRKDGKTLDAKTLRRLAQNREAARKSRLRKKAYVQQLETSRIKLTQLEQELHRARSQGHFFVGTSTNASISSGATVFDMEYAQWLEENFKHMTELRGGLQAHLCDGDLSVIVEESLAHYDEIFHIKAIAAKSDVFHLITGLWATPAERCFLWMGGFKPSDLLKVVMPQLNPLSEQQLLGICNLQQSSQQAEEALSQGFEQLQQALANTVTIGPLGQGTNAGNYMGHIGLALGKLSNLEGFVIQADNLRQQTLHQMHRILTVRQAARCFLAIGEYYSRLRALSSLWASRPQENLTLEENGCATTAANLQVIHQTQHTHFSAF